MSRLSARDKTRESVYIACERLLISRIANEIDAFSKVEKNLITVLESERKFFEHKYQSLKYTERNNE